jgi:hypothetical protein
VVKEMEFYYRNERSDGESVTLVSDDYGNTWEMPDIPAEG